MQKKITSPFQKVSRRGFLNGAFASFAVVAGLGNLPAMAAETTLSAKEAYKKAKTGEIILVDVRTPGEWAQTGVGEGAIGIDMQGGQEFINSLMQLRQLYPEKPIALICRTGNRSSAVFDYLKSQGASGFMDVTEGMAGGPNGRGWIPRGLPTYAGTKANIKTRLQAVLTK